jgi:hypothetical protein
LTEIAPLQQTGHWIATDRHVADGPRIVERQCF